MPYRLDGLLSWCLRLTWLYILVTAAGAVGTYFELSLLHRIDSGALTGLEAREAAERSDTVVGLVGITELAVAIIVHIVNGVWIYRASSNARAIDPWDGRIRPGWAVGWFFVPLANFWMPYRALGEMWRSAHGVVQDRKAALPGWMSFWWLFWLVSQVSGNITARTSMRAETIADHIFADYAALVSSVTALPCAWLFMRLMREISAGLDDRRSFSEVFA